MAQMTSRIHIRVTSPEVWSRFTEAIDPDLDLAPLASKDVTTFFHNDLAYLPGQLTQVVTALVNVIQSDGIILADTTNINVDPYAYIVYSLGCGVKEIEEDGNYCFATNCIDAEDELLKCLNYKSYFKFTPEELENLKKVGIEAVKKEEKRPIKGSARSVSPKESEPKTRSAPKIPKLLSTIFPLILILLLFMREYITERRLKPIRIRKSPSILTVWTSKSC